jgi:hypothetical protein
VTGAIATGGAETGALVDGAVATGPLGAGTGASMTTAAASVDVRGTEVVVDAASPPPPLQPLKKVVLSKPASKVRQQGIDELRIVRIPLAENFN